MKVLLLTEEYPPDGGGLGVSAQRVASSLNAIGVAVIVATFDYVPSGDDRELYTSYAREEVDLHGTRVVRIGPVPVSFATSGGRSVGSTYRSFAAQCLRLCRAERVDIVHSFGVTRAGHVGAMVSRQLSLPHIAGVRGNDIGRDLYNPTHFGSLAFVLETAARVCFVATGLFRLASDVLGHHDTWCLIPNGFEAEELNSSELAILGESQIFRAAFPGSRPVVGIFGDVREKKGVVEVIRAAWRLESPPHLLIVGAPAREEWYAQAVTSACDSAPPGVVTLQTGRISRLSTFAAMSACDLVTQASLDDGLPNTLVEAMWLGRPVVAAELFRADIGGDAAIFCDPYSERSLVQALHTMLTDATVRRRYGLAARRAAELRHTAAAEALAYQALYSEVANGF